MLLSVNGEMRTGRDAGRLLGKSSHDLPDVNYWEDWYPEVSAKLLIMLARSERFELPTLRFEV